MSDSHHHWLSLIQSATACTDYFICTSMLPYKEAINYLVYCSPRSYFKIKDETFDSRFLREQEDHCL